MLDRPNYKTVETSWIEKRDDINQGIATLPAPLREQALRKLAELKPVPPDISGLKPVEPNHLIESAHFVIGLDAQTWRDQDAAQQIVASGLGLARRPACALRVSDALKARLRSVSGNLCDQ